MTYRVGDYGQRITFDLVDENDAVLKELMDAIRVYYVIKIPEGTFEKDCTVENIETGTVYWTIEKDFILTPGLIQIDVKVEYADGRQSLIRKIEDNII